MDQRHDEIWQDWLAPLPSPERRDASPARVLRSRRRPRAGDTAIVSVQLCWRAAGVSGFAQTHRCGSAASGIRDDRIRPGSGSPTAPMDDRIRHIGARARLRLGSREGCGGVSSGLSTGRRQAAALNRARGAIDRELRSRFVPCAARLRSRAGLRRVLCAAVRAPWARRASRRLVPPRRAGPRAPPR